MVRTNVPNPSNNVYYYYYTTGMTYVKLYNVNTDLCSVTVSASDPGINTANLISASMLKYYGWIIVKTVTVTTTGPRLVDAEFDLTINC
jgi:hypothetical protein